MIRLLWTMAKIALVVAAAVGLAHVSGHVTVRFEGLVVETRTGVLLVTLLLIALVAGFVYRYWLVLRRLPTMLRVGQAGRRRERGYRALSLGMVAVAAGAADEAKRRAREADRLLDGAPLTLLLSAQAAQLDGDDSAARRFFEAMLNERETSFLGLRGLMVQADRAGDRAEALALAARAQKERPGTPWVLEALFDLQTASGDWDGAAATVDAMAARRLLAGEALRRRRAVVAVERSRLAEERGEEQAALAHARAAWKLEAGLVPAAARLARLEAAGGRTGRAEKILRTAWAGAPHPLLAEALATLQDGLAPAVRLTRARQLLKAEASRPETAMLLADLALAAGEPEEARRLLEPLAGEDAPAPARACRQLAGVALADGDADGARRWLLRAGAAPGDPVWSCRACSAIAPAWGGVCPHCGAFDSLDWRPPAPPAPEQTAAIAAMEQEIETGIAAPPSRPAAMEPAREA